MGKMDVRDTYRWGGCSVVGVPSQGREGWTRITTASHLFHARRLPVGGEVSEALWRRERNWLGKMGEYKDVGL